MAINSDIKIKAKIKAYTSTSGFTLIEIMVVLVIIAVMTGIAVLQIGSSSRSHFMADVYKVSTTLDLLADEAVYTNSVIVCGVGERDFTCTRYKNGDWQDMDLAKLTSWSWPSNLVVKTATVDGVVLKDDEKIRFTATGEISPISLELGDGVHSAWVDGDINGNFVVNN